MLLAEEAMKQRTLKQHHEDALEIAARSHALWQPVNQAIAEVLGQAVRNRHSRQWVRRRLLRMAGPMRPGEPVAVGNFRSAARQITEGTDRLTLI